jgi:hypothetical protein
LHAEQRRQQARRGGKAKGSRQIAEVRRNIGRILAAVEHGGMDRADASVMFQGFGVLIKAIALELKAVDYAEIREGLEELEEARRRSREYQPLGMRRG